ncbi:MAG: hypothetical protein U0232_30250 [Thermomicrobiales bacterium]
MLTLTYGSAHAQHERFPHSWEVEPGKRIYGDGWPMLRQMEALRNPRWSHHPIHRIWSGTAKKRVRREQDRPLAAKLPIRYPVRGVAIDAALAPGEYLINIYLNWGINEADYGFRIAVIP